MEAAVLEGSRVCGALRWQFQDMPSSATACNCTLCRRYGVLWAYGHEGENIQLMGPSKVYVRADWAGFHFCADCGCVAYWRALKPDKDGRRRAAVNLRLSEPAPVARIALRHLDGLDSWKELPQPAQCVADLWF
jgi:hypothetical protein